MWSEIALSREALESHTGQKVRIFAFAGNAFPDWTGRIIGEARIYTRGNIRIATGRGDSAESYRKQLDEKVSVNGKDAAPNASGAVLAHTGDTIAVR